MTDPNHGEPHGPNFRTYIVIFVVLSICTLLSFVVNGIMGQNHASMGVIMVIAVIKAVCVVAIFMHVKFEWSKLYFLIIPVLILGVMMMIVLLPDIVIDWHHGPVQ
jgi:cytochrome c oxidase subunit IV